MTEVATRPIMENNQALQMALELSMLNLNSTTNNLGVSEAPTAFGVYEEEGGMRMPRSQNITHCVAVPSSEHVAEIVGRQGCKIKALRAKTNTYIKTPARGEDPIFVITGRPEDVSAAKREVTAAAEHFTQIRAARKNNAMQNQTTPCVGSPVEERVTIYVRVPYRVVGLVVGPKGATIKRIQQLTNTYIVTPSRDKEPCFEVTGKPEDAERAKREIESYIAMRTGGSVTDSDSDSEYSSLVSPAVENNSPGFSPGSHRRRLSDATTRSSRLIQQFSPRSSVSPPTPAYVESGAGNGPPLESLTMSTTAGSWGGVQEAAATTRSPLSSAVFGRCAHSSSFNAGEMFVYGTPPLSAPVSIPSSGVFDFSSMQQESLPKQDPPSPTYSFSSNSSEGTAVTSPKPFARPMRRHSCMVCQERDVVAALVPCGHNLFCFTCANGLVSSGMGFCPLCSARVNNVLRIYTC